MSHTDYTLNAVDALAKGTTLMETAVRTDNPLLMDQGRATIQAAAVWAQLASTAHLMAGGTPGSGKGGDLELVDLSGKRGGPIA